MPKEISPPEWAGELAISRMRQYLEPLVTQDDLEAVNNWLATLSCRPLTFRELSLLTLIHIRSVVENDGFSPFNRFISFAETYPQLFFGPLILSHVTAALSILESIKLTTLIDKPVKATKYKAGRCGRYKLF